jgi:hypothetical protein
VNQFCSDRTAVCEDVMKPWWLLMALTCAAFSTAITAPTDDLKNDRCNA